MRAEEITDAESLQAWLESLPQETEEQRETARRWAVTIAHRAAMRVLPVFWEWSLSAWAKQQEVTAIAILWPNLAASLISAMTSETLKSTVGRTIVQEVNAYGASASAQSASRSAIAVSRAASEPTPIIFVASVVIEAAHAMADAGMKDPKSILLPVREDAIASEQGITLEGAPFHRHENDLSNLWARTKPSILAQGEGWRFWVEWYENALYGRPQDYDLLTKIATDPRIDWDKGADHVNALIAQIRLEHIAETRPLGEDAIDIGPDGLWHRTGKSDINSDTLQDAVESVQDEIATLRTKLQGPQGNMFTALVSDLDLLEQRIARHPDRPLRLHDLFIRVQGHIARNLQSGELPDDDCVRDLSSVLGNAALDMCNACDKTKTVVQERISARFNDVDGQTRKGLTLLAEGAAQISDGELAEEFKEDAATVTDVEIPAKDKEAAQYRLHTRLAQLVVRDGKNLLIALALIDTLGGGFATLGNIILFLLGFVVGL